MNHPAIGVATLTFQVSGTLDARQGTHIFDVKCDWGGWFQRVFWRFLWFYMRSSDFFLPGIWLFLMHVEVLFLWYLAKACMAEVANMFCWSFSLWLFLLGGKTFNVQPASSPHRHLRRCPEMGVPPVLIHFNRIFPYKPTSYGGTPILGPPPPLQHISKAPRSFVASTYFPWISASKISGPSTRGTP